LKLNFKTSLICRLQQPRAKGRVNLVRSIYDKLSQTIQFFWNFLVHLGALGVLVVRF
jgi:hypothetical protein